MEQEEIKVRPVRYVKVEKVNPNGWKEKRRKILLNNEVSRFKIVFKDNFVTFIISALGLVAALSWNDAVRTTIDTLFPSQANLIYKYYAAIVVTIISITATFFLSKLKPEK